MNLLHLLIRYRVVKCSFITVKLVLIYNIQILICKYENYYNVILYLSYQIASALNKKIMSVLVSMQYCSFILVLNIYARFETKQKLSGAKNDYI